MPAAQVPELGRPVMVESGRLTPVVGGSHPLRAARRAQEDLLSWDSRGELVPDASS